MNFKYLLTSGHVPLVHPAAMFLFLAFLAMSVFLKKAFCSWLCPVGTLSENLWKLGRKLFGRNFQLPKWADLPLRGLKYLLLAFFVFVIGAMSAETLEGFMQSPYGLMADVKMLNFFRGIGVTGIVGSSGAGSALHAGPELLVPLSLPVRCDPGALFSAESAQDSPRCERLHRVRQMRS